MLPNQNRSSCNRACRGLIVKMQPDTFNVSCLEAGIGIPNCLLPSWLTDRFEHTGLKVRSGPWHQGLASHPAVVIEPDGNFLDFEVWKCEFEPGEVMLGRPREFKVQGFHSLMYGVAVKSRSK